MSEDRASAASPGERDTSSAGGRTGRRGRLALVLNKLARGGAETQVTTLATGFARRGWQVELFSMRRPDAFVEELHDAGVPIRTLRMPQWIPGPLATPWLSWKLRRFRPDIVHSHMYQSNILARLARPLAGVPVLISTAHNIAEGAALGDEPGRVDRIYRLTDRLCDLTTNVSRAAVARYVRVGAAPERRIRYVPNGVDAERFQPDADERTRMRTELGLGDHPTLIAIGRFSEQKDYPAMIEAFRLVHDAIPDSRLLLVGTGALEDSIRAQVAASGLSETVRLLGVRTDVAALMNAADLYVMSSRWEGLPIVLLEAGASGLPMVVTDVGGNAEVVEYGVSGFVVPAKQPKVLADAALRFLSLPANERAAFGVAARQTILREYAVDRVLDQWEAIYWELLARKARR